MLKTIVIDNSGPYDGSMNGAVCQEIVFGLKGSPRRYRIKINSESVQSQSYARLEAWTTVGFSNIITRNPKKHYGIDASHKYQGNIPAEVFAPIINDLTEVASRFESATKEDPQKQG